MFGMLVNFWPISNAKPMLNPVIPWPHGKEAQAQKAVEHVVSHGRVLACIAPADARAVFSALPYLPPRKATT